MATAVDMGEVDELHSRDETIKGNIYPFFLFLK